MSTGIPARRGRGRPRLVLAAFVGPFVLLFCGVYIVPLAYAVYRSLFRVQASGLGFGGARDVFVGLANYADVVGTGSFWASVAHVLSYGVVQIPVMMAAAMAIALLIDSRAARSRGFFRLTTFLPYAVPGIVATLLWTYLYVPQLSPIVKGLGDLGWTVDLLGRHIVVFSMANIAIWSWTGYNMVIYTASLQSIPQEVTEAARVDGAGEWRIATRIKAPLIRGSIFLTGLMSIIGTIQLFNEPFILRTVTTSISAEWTPMMTAYNATFGSNNFELGSAVSVVIALIAGVLAIVYQKLATRKERY